MDHLVREPTGGDADALGRVHVRAWQAAYRNGLMPDAYLDGLREAERADMWRQSLENPPRARSLRLVGETSAGNILGFALVGLAESDSEAMIGELYAINVDPDYWGTGLGSDLIQRGIAALVEFGFTEAVLWVDPDNQRARRFYEARGWDNDEIERRQTILGVDLPEVRYSLTIKQATLLSEDYPAM